MLTPPQLVHEAHGSPEVDGCAAGEGRCYVCVGEANRGKLIKDWLSSNFTDQNRARCPAATHVCEACCYVMSRISPVMGRPPKDGKQFGGNFRNYSSLYSEGWLGTPFGESPAVPCYANASKGEKPLIREFLQREHTGFWFAAIADSGQKHVLPFAPLNYGPGGMVLFEEELVEVPPSFELVDACTDMLTGGITKDELLSGDYRVMSYREMRAEIRAFESEHGAWRGSGWMSLAVWLAQRDNDAHAVIAAERKEKAGSGRQPGGSGVATSAGSARKSQRSASRHFCRR
jgi:hypothetical protein